MSRLGMRFWIEAGLGSISSALFIVTLAWPDWLEIVLNIDPDGGNGAVEWAVVAALALVAVPSLAFARLDWRRAHLVLHSPPSSR